MESRRGLLVALTVVAVAAPSVGEAATIGHFGSASAALRDRYNVRIDVDDIFHDALPDKIEIVAGTGGV